MGLQKRAMEDAKLTGMVRDSARSYLSRGEKGFWVSHSLKWLGSQGVGWGGMICPTKSLCRLLAICFCCSPVWSVCLAPCEIKHLTPHNGTMKHLPEVPRHANIIILETSGAPWSSLWRKHICLSFPPFLFYQQAQACLTNLSNMVPLPSWTNSEVIFPLRA